MASEANPPAAVSRSQFRSMQSKTREESKQEAEIYIMKTLNMEPYGFDEYMLIYTRIHDYCSIIDKNGDGKKDQSGGANFGGQEMYDKIRETTKVHVSNVYENIEKHSGHDLIEVFSLKWEEFLHISKTIHNMANYLNRYWIKRQLEENKRNVYDINTMLFVVWRERLFNNLSEKLTTAIIQTIERDRMGESINSSALKSCLNCYVLLGINAIDQKNTNLEVYKESFEEKFLKTTAKFYENESKEFLKDNSLVDYMKKVERRLEEEELRLDRYLHPSSKQPLVSLCERVLLENYLEQLSNESKVIMEKEMESDLLRMYNLLGRINNGLESLRQNFGSHICKVGFTMLDTLGNVEEDPKLYVEKLLEIHKRFLHVTVASFKNDAGFVASFDRACREIVNKNSFCSKSSTKSPELICKYVDTLLKKKANNPEPEEHEELLKNVMIIFKYIEDKDVFQKYYSRALAKRLVQNTSASDDAEIGMISKLKEACGSDYTFKFTRMINDVQTSDQLSRDFKNSSFNSSISGIDLDVKVLSSGAWPLTSVTTTFAIPEILEQTMLKFQQFYQAKHSGRKLNWLFNVSKGEVKANYTSTKTGYTFQVSTYQMGILLNYNSADVYTFTELQESTKLPDEILSQVIASLCKAKVLLPDSENSEPSTKYSLNFDFKSKKIKINLNVPLKTEQKTEEDENQRNILEDRKLLIQAAIVRIMKTRKQISHQLLMTEILSQLQARFKPAIADIKRCIDILIEKEYMERLEGQKDVYCYIA